MTQYNRMTERYLSREADRALERIWDEVRFLAPDDGVKVLEEALDELKRARDRYHRALGK